MPQANEEVGRIAGFPLEPGLLRRIGALKEFPPTPAGFRAEGAWVNLYRVFACHGYVDRGNDNVGYLRLQREPEAQGDLFTLKAEQQIVNDGGAVHRTEVRMRCRGDRLATPVEWSLNSRLFTPVGRPADLDSQEQGRFSAGVVEIAAAGATVRFKIPGRLAADFSLFEAVQRLAFKPQPAEEFDVLEGMSLLRRGHRLVYDSAPSASLRRFHQIGHGLLPYQYWLDEKHRLLLVTSQSRAYVLDDRAEEAARRHQESEQQRALQRKGGRKGGA